MKYEEGLRQDMENEEASKQADSVKVTALRKAENVKETEVEAGDEPLEGCGEKVVTIR